MKKIIPFRAFFLSLISSFLAFSCSKPLETSIEVAQAKTALPIPAFLSDVPASKMMRMDDGPFWGAEFPGDVGQLEVSEQMKYSEGELFVCNRSLDESPILYFKDSGGEIAWVVDLDPSVDPEYETNSLVQIYNCSVGGMGTRKALHFVAEWDFGHEAGVAYFGPEAEFGCFYLSW